MFTGTKGPSSSKMLEQKAKGSEGLTLGAWKTMQAEGPARTSPEWGLSVPSSRKKEGASVAGDMGEERKSRKFGVYDCQSNKSIKQTNLDELELSC